jgi:hypothetical protein
MRSNLLLLVAASIMLSGCVGSIFGGREKTKLAPQAYMPEPPPTLMEPTKPLNTIKK